MFHMVWLFVLLEIPKDVRCFTDYCYTETSSLNCALDDQGASGIWESMYLTDKVTDGFAGRKHMNLHLLCLQSSSAFAIAEVNR